MQKYSIESIKKVLGPDVKVKGNVKNKYFSNVSTIFAAVENSLVWVDPKRNDRQELVSATKAKFIICDDSINTDKLLSDKIFIISDNPKLTFIKVASALFTPNIQFGIHSTAVISHDAKIDKNVYIGPNVVIGKCEIKEGSIIHGNTFIYDNTFIGENVTIHAGCVIGSDGYGYVRNENNEFEKFPHFGGVVIQKNVEIGANTCIDRGTLGNTIIKEGAKIDNLVHIAHNVVIGKHTAVIANSMIGGSTTIGDYSWIAPSASLMNKIKINDKVTVGMAAVVTKDIPDGETWTGSPARPLNEFIEYLNKIKKL